MATCSPAALLEAGECFCGMSATQKIELVLLCQILQAFSPMSTCSIAQLMADAKSFQGTGANVFEMLKLQLLCEIKAVATGIGNVDSEVIRGVGSPVDPPSKTAALYYDTDPAALTVLYWWDGSAWIPFG